VDLASLTEKREQQSELSCKIQKWEKKGVDSGRRGGHKSDAVCLPFNYPTVFVAMEAKQTMNRQERRRIATCVQVQGAGRRAGECLPCVLCTRKEKKEELRRSDVVYEQCIEPEVARKAES